MKNIATFSVVLLLVCGGVLTAQEAGGSPDSNANREAPLINFEAYGKTIWAPFVYRGQGDMRDMNDKSHYGPGYGVGGGPGWERDINAAVGFRVYSDPGSNIGFDLGLRALPIMGTSNEAGKFEIWTADNTAYIWAQLFGMFRMQFGAYQWDDLRGKIGGISEVVGGYGGAEDDIFQRVESDVFGALFILRPPSGAPEAIRGLSLFASFGVSGGLDGVNLLENTEFAAKSKNALKNIFSTPHVGIAYQNDIFGLARLQFIASDYTWGSDDDWNTRIKYFPWYGTSAQVYNAWFPSNTRAAAQLELAVNVTSIPNMSIDLGIGIPFSVEVKKGEGNNRPVGPAINVLGIRTFYDPDPDKNHLAGYEGDIWQPPVKIAAGLDWRLPDLGLGLRFRAKIEFGERVTFIDKSDDFKGGLNLELGVEPSYYINNVGTVSLAVALRMNENDSFNGKKDVANYPLSVTNDEAINSINHNGVVDLGLGVFFTGRLQFGTIKTGVCMTLPVGGDRYNWSSDNVPGTYNAYFRAPATEAYKQGSLIIAVPVILELTL